MLKKLRKLGDSFKNRTKSEMYRKKGGAHYVFVPRTDKLSELYVSSTLQQCGVTMADAKEFIAEAGT